MGIFDNIISKELILKLGTGDSLFRVVYDIDYYSTCRGKFVGLFIVNKNNEIIAYVPEDDKKNNLKQIHDKKRIKVIICDGITNLLEAHRGMIRTENAVYDVDKGIIFRENCHINIHEDGGFTTIQTVKRTEYKRYSPDGVILKKHNNFFENCPMKIHFELEEHKEKNNCEEKLPF